MDSRPYYISFAVTLSDFVDELEACAKALNARIHEDIEAYTQALSEGMTEPEKKPSVRKKLEECKKISEDRQSAKNLAKELDKITPPKKPDVR